MTGLGRLRRPKPQRPPQRCLSTHGLAQLRRSPWTVLALELTRETPTLKLGAAALRPVNVTRHRGLLCAQPLDRLIRMVAPPPWSLLLGLVPPQTVETLTLKIWTVKTPLTEICRCRYLHRACVAVPSCRRTRPVVLTCVLGAGVPYTLGRP